MSNLIKKSWTDSNPGGPQLITKVAIFNFQFKVWIDIPKMKEELQDVCWSCAMATFFGKQTRSRILVVFNGFGIYEYNSILQKKKLVCLTIISIQTANYHPDMNLYPDTSSATDKSTLYSVDINSNNYASWNQESIWFHSVDQSIGM